MAYILSIDQGTTSSRAIIYNRSLQTLASASQEFTQHFPKPGWVEHDAEEIWQSVLTVIRRALSKASLSPKDIAGIGLTNQRETVVAFEAATGKPVHHALVWQDRRTATLCQNLKNAGHETALNQKTGLLLDPYFSATKIAWMLRHIDGLRARVRTGEVFFGTIDTYLIYRLTGERSFVTDATNAARTALYNIHERRWSQALTALFDVPTRALAHVRDSSADFGSTARDVVGAAIPICGVAGDQQAATVGQACFNPGMLKSTYGTGCFALLNTGTTPVKSNNKLLTTIAYQLDGQVAYALEGSIFVAGAAIQWLRDGLHILDRANQAGPMAAKSRPDEPIYMVPAFTGLGAPHWDAYARGAIYGLTRNTSPEDFARAALEAVCYQTADLLAAMQADWAASGHEVETATLRVDGGMVACDWMLQFLSDILNTPVERPKTLESTALGVAYLAGLRLGLLPSPASMHGTWALDCRFDPVMDATTRTAKLAGWHRAVQRTLT